MPDVRLDIDGVGYGGWQQIRIQRSMEQIAGSFELTVSERWPGQDAPRPIRPGNACRLTIDGDTVITGYVDDVTVEYDGANHTVRVAGRDKTADLVDCSAPSTEWKGQTLLEGARKLCAPFGIRVSADVDTGGKFARLKGNEGDAVFDLLESAARIRAVLLVSDGLGNLLLTRAATRRIATSLVLGENVLECSAQFSHRDRFSTYTVKGQRAGDDTWSTTAAAHPSAKATDQRVTRHRPLLVIAEEQIDAAAAGVRAKWERNVRWGRSQRITYTVQGWRHAGGLWAPNWLVNVRDGLLGIEGDRLLAGVTFLLDGQGLRTELSLVPREAFERVALPEPDGDATWAAT